MTRRVMVDRRLAVFLPLLVIYITLVVAMSTNAPKGDETGYLRIANRLAGQGTAADRALLWWGPGYPTLLVPFVVLGIPLLGAKLLNALLLFGAVIYFYKTVTLWMRKRTGAMLTLMFGMYPPFLRYLHLLYTEIFALFLVCGFAYHFIRFHDRTRLSWKHLLLSAFWLAFLALTKVFFGYVVVAGLCLSGVAFLWKRHAMLLKTFLLCALALVLCLPHLRYSYEITGKHFYWGSSGGLSLYWMSSPYAGELGSWHSFADVMSKEALIPHRAFFSEIVDLPKHESDAALRKRAVNNIARHPVKFAANWAANVSRLLFAYPYTNQRQQLRTLFYSVPNMFLIVLFGCGIYPAIKGRRRIPGSLYSILCFGLISLGGLSLLSACARMFIPLIPIFLIWVSFLYSTIIRLSVCEDTEVSG